MLVNPSSRAFPPSRLGKVCKHPLLSAWRRLEALGSLGSLGVTDYSFYPIYPGYPSPLTPPKNKKGHPQVTKN